MVYYYLCGFSWVLVVVAYYLGYNVRLGLIFGFIGFYLALLFGLLCYSVVVLAFTFFVCGFVV